MNKQNNKLIIHLNEELFKPSAHIKLEGSFSLSSFRSSFDDYEILDDVYYKIKITNTGDAFLVSGNASTIAKTSCSRCLEDIETKLNAKIDSYILIEEPKNFEENNAYEFDVLPRDHNLDLGKIISLTMRVDVPMKPLCKQNCKGLCSTCGRNLNRDNCVCDNKIDSSNPFSVLQNVKID